MYRYRKALHLERNVELEKSYCEESWGQAAEVVCTYFSKHWGTSFHISGLRLK